MSKYDKINKFAEIWLNKFRNQTTDSAELLSCDLANDCAALGFEADSGAAFEGVYGQAAYDGAELDKIIDDVTDVYLLGSAIFSRWYYFKAHGGDEILEFKNRAWFILALSRLALLTGDNPFIFNGVVRKMKIVSNNICYGPKPNPEDEVEQRLTVNADGRVWFSAYAYGDGDGRYAKIKRKIFSIEKSAAGELLNKVAAYFSDEYDQVFATDIGNWTMELTNTDGRTYEFYGSLCSDFIIEGVNLSDLLRYTLGMPNLYAFDGKRKPEGYYDEIRLPLSKKDELAALFSEYKIIEHTKSEEEYGYLEENAVLVEIVNPYGGENLFIKLAKGFTLFFSGWHAHYSAYEYDFSVMKNLASAIIHGEYAAACFSVNGEQIGGELIYDEVSYSTNPADLIEEMHFDEEHIQAIKDNGAVININYWKPNDCWEFDVEKSGVKEQTYTFPRRYGVRYAVKDGIDYGSGAQKRYDCDTAMITYVYIDPSDDEIELTKAVIAKLEQDARSSGAKRIFVNIENSDIDFFSSLGYAQVARIDNDTVHRLYGTVVVFDKTMMKIL